MRRIAQARRLFYAAVLLALLPVPLAAQGALQELEAMDDAPVRNLAEGTFKAERVAYGPSVETTGPLDLVFVVQHRFGPISQGAYEWFGLDQANTRLGFDFGVLPWLSLGIGRSSFEKQVDGHVKARLLRQQTGQRNLPVSVTLQASAAAFTLRPPNPEVEYELANRMRYATGLLVARKFSDRLSLQLSGHWVHRNLVATAAEVNSLFLPGVAGRFKFSRRLAITGEYYPLLDAASREAGNSLLSIGLDIETGGHVFQLMFGNGVGMTEPQFLPGSPDDWLEGDLRFGFNIVRVFGLGRKIRSAKSAS